MVSFTVPLFGWTIAATATVVISCSSLQSCDAGVFVSRCRVVVVLLLVVPTILFGTVVKPVTGKFIFLFPVSRGRWVCMLAELLVQQQ